MNNHCIVFSVAQKHIKNQKNVESHIKIVLLLKMTSAETTFRFVVVPRCEEKI